MKAEGGEQAWREFSARWLPRVEERLAAIMGRVAAGPGCPPDLTEAMRYALLGGGKRLRPLAALAAAAACGGQEGQALDAGCAVELVHCYSLVHDDLPALDNDDFRRGRPSCHKAFGEALALLAGDALLTHAFFLLSQLKPAGLAARATEILSRAAGPWGMAGGQADDIRAWDGLDLAAVENLQLRKTAALFAAAMELGALTTSADEQRLLQLSRLGHEFGLAFQIVDDLLAWRKESEELGRPAGSDEKNRRPVHPRLAGEDFSRRRAGELLASARALLDDFGSSAAALSGLVAFVQKRLSAR